MLAYFSQPCVFVVIYVQDHHHHKLHFFLMTNFHNFYLACWLFSNIIYQVLDSAERRFTPCYVLRVSSVQIRNDCYTGMCARILCTYTRYIHRCEKDLHQNKNSNRLYHIKETRESERPGTEDTTFYWNRSRVTQHNNFKSSDQWVSVRF